MGKGFFVTGTDTGVGKTFVSCLLLRTLAAQNKNVVGMKPIAAGKENGKWLDVELLRMAGNVPVSDAMINPYALDAPIAPHIAARQQGVEITLDKIGNVFFALKNKADYVIVEGAGGFLVPVNARQDTADLARFLELPVILVVGMRLGCINHALLTVQAIMQTKLPMAGWVANCIDPSMRAQDENIATLQQRIDAPLLGVMPFDSEPDTMQLQSCLSIDRLCSHRHAG